MPTNKIIKDIIKNTVEPDVFVLYLCAQLETK